MKRKTFLIGALAGAFIMALPGLTSRLTSGPGGGDREEPQVKRAMALLRQKTAALGTPSLKGTDTVAGQVVPALRFGTTTLNNNKSVVNTVRAESGGWMTATLFARQGQDFIRVATNVPNANCATHALGTRLDPSGPVIEKIRNGEPYYGLAPILGTQYITGYEPIKSATGEVIGIYYVGFTTPHG